MKKLTIILTGFTLIFSACNSLKVVSDYDPQVNFSTYRTFRFMENEDDTYNTLVQSRIKEEVTKNMEKLGYSYDDEAPLAINLMHNVTTERQVTTTSNFYSGRRYYHYAEWDVNVYDYKKGSLVIDLVDVKKNILIWQGAVEGTLSQNKEKNKEKISKGVEAIFMKYPHVAGKHNVAFQE